MNTDTDHGSSQIKEKIFRGASNTGIFVPSAIHPRAVTANQRIPRPVFLELQFMEVIDTLDEQRLFLSITRRERDQRTSSLNSSFDQTTYKCVPDSDLIGSTLEVSDDRSMLLRNQNDRKRLKIIPLSFHLKELSGIVGNSLRRTPRTCVSIPI